MYIIFTTWSKQELNALLQRPPHVPELHPDDDPPLGEPPLREQLVVLGEEGVPVPVAILRIVDGIKIIDIYVIYTMSDIPEYGGYGPQSPVSHNPNVEHYRTRNPHSDARIAQNTPEFGAGTFTANTVYYQMQELFNTRRASAQNAAYFGGMRDYQHQLGRIAAQETAFAADAIRENHRLRNDSQTREAAARRAITMGLAGNDQLFLANEIAQNWSPDLLNRFIGYLPSDE
jgi:hypothetical protein